MGAKYYFTGPIHHDILAELIFSGIALFVCWIVWKVFKLEWPKF